MAKVAVVIPAAGSGTRMQLDYPKQYHKIGGMPVLVHTVRTFLQSGLASQIVVVVPENHLEETRKLFIKYRLASPIISVTAGGRRRQDSVFCGVQQLRPEISTVMIHDGVRPFVSPRLIKKCLDAAAEHGAAISAIPVKDTLKRQTGEQFISKTIDRTGLWQAQTPQVFQISLLKKAYAENVEVTDEAGLLEVAGIPVFLVEGEETNIKITRPEDLLLAEKLTGNNMQFRIGHGFDAHRFEEGRKLVLGGVTIPHDHGLAGHSDADVLTHAVCDAILGGLGVGDIGRHFPDSASEFKGIYSIKLLEYVVEMMDNSCCQLVNLDATIVCQRPKLAPYLDEMAAILAAACKVSPQQINLKATTTEKMGYTGREEGISTHAVALIQNVNRTKK
ncbi:MAG: bifunctional 2-C-methyl-D-erythritol 4-phosphate cytidylyltransferase/2-C-methyl-D-erythritol 2,4-cyclodiphosphate synthase [Deltaproteobacteria bacterium]|nr:MAG: bifunctional 2-C-methyl-D-erythritol 4-phosphate cytidylyltransferase/2-C-methyl-D-erythritol 2,4-cyclodiphosphate synthase [Deltaproteobacteria bacterium]